MELVCIDIMVYIVQGKVSFMCTQKIDLDSKVSYQVLKLNDSINCHFFEWVGGEI